LHLPLKVDAKRALKVAGIDGQPMLRFIPHWRYHIISNGEKTFKDRLIPFKADRWGALNAINGMPLEIPLDKIESSSVPGDADIQSPKKQKADVEEQIVAGLTDELTQRLRLRTEKGDAIFYEEKVFKPERKDIQITIDMVYVPVWEIRGKKIVEVNGFTGEILCMPMDEGAEVL
ncbi:MAG TPA: hypothetical protein VE134_05760, partial [Methanomicrobiales archaeon]|nr:hypothetical protein [Methanomicrobiales archaeon]